MPSRLNTPPRAPLTRANPTLCASALSRLLWAAGTLLLLWATVYWALS